MEHPQIEDLILNGPKFVKITVMQEKNPQADSKPPLQVFFRNYICNKKSYASKSTTSDITGCRGYAIKSFLLFAHPPWIRATFKKGKHIISTTYLIILG